MTVRSVPVAPSPLRRNRGFVLLWFGEGVSVLGAMASTVVLPLIAVDRFHATAMQMGLLSAAAWLPWFVLGLGAGALVDRFDNRRVMIIADLVAGAVMATIPLAALVGLLGFGQLLAAALVTGTCTVFFRTAYAGFVPEVVADEHLDGANARLVGTESAMQVAGPGLGGGLAAAIGAVGAVLMQTIGFVVSAVCLIAIGRGTAPERRGSPPTSRGQGALLREIREGIVVTGKDPYLRFFAIAGGVSNLGLVGYQSLLVLFMIESAGLAPAAVGWIMSLGAVGGIIGALVAPALARRVGTARAIVVLIVPTGPAALLIPLAGPGWQAWPLVVGPLLVGVGVVGANAVRTAWRQRYTPPELLGRTIGAFAVINYGLIPLGGVLAGLLGSWYGVRAAIAVLAGVHLLGTLAHVVSPLWGHRDLPTRMPKISEAAGTDRHRHRAGDATGADGGAERRRAGP